MQLATVTTMPRKKKASFTTSEVADILNVHRVTVAREIRRGNLVAAKVGRHWRVRRADLESYWQARGGGQLFIPPASK